MVIVWMDGSMEDVSEALTDQAIADGARLATASEADDYAAWLDNCD